MKELLKQYAAYNLWANQKLIDVVNALTEEQVNRDINSSFNSIYKTMLHAWVAESIWWLRLQAVPPESSPALTFNGTAAELCSNIAGQSGIWRDWVNAASDDELQQELSYQNIAKENYRQPVYQIVLHVFNHGSYHRGQLITMLRQAGVEKLPSTDFTTYTRLKQPAI